ncbi:MAG: nitrogenase component 1 [Chloroflexota bacterium]
MAYIERPRFSCALGGALETINSLPNTVPIIHAASGCGGNLFSSQQQGGFYGSGFCGGLAVPSSNISESDIIFGGEDRLKEQVGTTLEIIEAELFIVVTGCMTEIIGDDAKSVVNHFKASKKPVLAISTGGFNGNSYRGYDLVLKTIFTEFLPKVATKQKNLVNLWGLVPGKDPFFRGDLEELKRLLGLLGLEVNTFFGHSDTLANLYSANTASANIVLSRVYGIETAVSFEEKHGTPFIVQDLPIGATATAEFLFNIAEFLGIDRQLVTQVVANEKKHFYYYVERIIDIYLDSELQHYAIVVENANYCYSVTRFLAEDLGWIPVVSVITDKLEEEQKQLLSSTFKDFSSIKAPELLFETNTSAVLPLLTGNKDQVGTTLRTDIQPGSLNENYLQTIRPLFVFGSSLELELANRLGAKSLSISFPLTTRAVLNRSYAGFRGGLHLFEDTLNVLLSGR